MASLADREITQFLDDKLDLIPPPVVRLLIRGDPSSYHQMHSIQIVVLYGLK